MQVANPDFFLKMVPLMDGGDDVGMVLSPQSFHNLQPHADIFNHANIQFWEYAQHGYDAIDFISCTGAAAAPDMLSILILVLRIPHMVLWCDNTLCFACLQTCSSLLWRSTVWRPWLLSPLLCRAGRIQAVECASSASD